MDTTEDLEIYIDGACTGNPGPAAIGVVIKRKDKVLKEISKTIGEATNNVAEYKALISALQESKLLRRPGTGQAGLPVRQAGTLKISTDSELLFRQICGRYKVKNEQLKSLFEEATRLMEGFGRIEWRQIPRSENKHADQLASKALKISRQEQRQAKTVVLTFPKA